jgi:hypothetical protein
MHNKRERPKIDYHHRLQHVVQLFARRQSCIVCGLILKPRDDLHLRSRQYKQERKDEKNGYHSSKIARKQRPQTPKRSLGTSRVGREGGWR